MQEDNHLVADGPAREQPAEWLWRKAQAAGISRRRFLLALTGGGAAAVLAACTRPTPVPTETPAPTPAPSPTPGRLLHQPVPEAYFIPIGAGNAEMRFEIMADRAYATPNQLFFIRNHAASPFIDVRNWRLRIEGDGVDRPLQLSYDDLLRLPTRTVTRYVECAGNGRSFFDSLLDRPAQGGQWGLGAYGVAEWTGVQLGELLDRAGIRRTAVDVMPTGLDSVGVERPMSVSKAMEDDTILAFLMNGDLLPVDHGFPARVIAPGWVGINSVKWVGKVTVSQTPIYVATNTTSYVLVGPDYPEAPPSRGPVITTQVMKSAVCLPWPATLTAGPQHIAGYAWSPLAKIARVEVSLDGGASFRDASLAGPNIERSGSRWEFSFDATPGDMTITPRATDDRGNVQYDVSQQRWNEKGYLFGATVPHPVRVLG